MEKEENVATVTVIVRYGKENVAYSHCNCKVWKRKENVATVTVIVRYGKEKKNVATVTVIVRYGKGKKMSLQSL